MKKIALVLCALTLVACGTRQPQPKIQLHTMFNTEQAQQLMREGTNTIKGSALMRQVSGGVVTCAGQFVGLVPATTYAYERIRHLYGSDLSGTRNAFLAQNNPDPFESTDPNYTEMQKRTLCDAQGFFKFEKLADGEFFILSSVSWKANPNSMYFEGGWMMKRVAVKGGEVKEIVMAP